ncbi:MAG: phospho-sugar mutase, partial [Spirochaetaceae bacterium]
YNRMNDYVIRRATTGLAKYILNNAGSQKPSIVIGHDSRHYSREFALEAALVCASHGIKAYLFADLRPTPQVSFAVRELGASSGIMVTASHNPPDYNGYKVYWNDGAQVLFPHDKGIIAEVAKVQETAKVLEEKVAIEHNLLEYLDSEFDEKFFAMAMANRVNPAVFAEGSEDFKVVCTPLHGTGGYPLQTVFSRLGVELICVPEQCQPDGDFPTVRFPNPEEAAALDMAISLAKEKQADLVIGTDPDADRLGIALPGSGANSDWILLNGNELGTLFVDYVFSSLSAKGHLPDKPVFVNTVVTTELQNRIAEKYGAVTYRTLTGFKHIADIIRKLEDSPDGGSFIMGDEESYGFMFGTNVRDKDAISSSIICAEMTLFHKKNGKSLTQRLHEIYEEFGWYKEILVSRYFEGQSGIQVMNGLMNHLRTKAPKEIANSRVVQIKDFLTGDRINPQTGQREKNIELPSSNVLQFCCENGSVISARPSGTEPKIKFYASVHTEQGLNEGEAKDIIANTLAGIEKTIGEWISTAEKL